MAASFALPMTQLVAALWIVALLAAVNWQARSEATQVVTEETAEAIQGWAQTGMQDCWAVAMKAKPSNCFDDKATPNPL